MLRRALVALVTTSLALGMALVPVAADAVELHPINATFWYHISVRISGKYVDVKKSSTKDGTALQQYGSNDHKSQQFRFIAQDDGYYQIVSKLEKTQSWDVTDELAADGTKVETWHWKDGTNQKWRAVEEVDGYISFRPLNSPSSCLTVPNASKSNSVQFVISHCVGSKSQQFKLHKGTKAIAGTCNDELLGKPTILGVILPVCGPKPGDHGGVGDSIYAYSGAFVSSGYQCQELSVRWLYHKWNVKVNGNGAAIVKNAYNAAKSKFTVYTNGTSAAKSHRPAPGDVISFSDLSTFDDGGHTGVVWKSVTVGKTVTIFVAEQNYLGAGGDDGIHEYGFSNGKLTGSDHPYIKWLHRK